MMRPSHDELAVYLCREPVDMRKSIDGLSLLVEQGLGLDPFAPQLYVFCNRARDKVKLLYWERNGFCLWYKRLEKARFRWPRMAGETVKLSGRELNWLLDGLDLERMQGHERLDYRRVA